MKIKDNELIESLEDNDIPDYFSTCPICEIELEDGICPECGWEIEVKTEDLDFEIL